MYFLQHIRNEVLTGAPAGLSGAQGTFSGLISSVLLKQGCPQMEGALPVGKNIHKGKERLDTSPPWLKLSTFSQS